MQQPIWYNMDKRECTICKTLLPPDDFQLFKLHEKDAYHLRCKIENTYPDLKKERVMEDKKEVIVSKEEKQPPVLSIMESPEKAVLIFDSLKKNFRNLLITNGEIIEIADNEYVRFEGWSTVALAMGIMPEVVELIKSENSYQAKAVAKLVKTGAVLGAGYGICSRDENNWKDRPEFAIASMAQTRACGKALKTILSGVIQHMGFAGTPAEEMEGVDTTAPKPVVSNFDKNKKPYESKGELKGMATDKQIIAIRSLCKHLGIGVDEIFEKRNVGTLEELTKQQASEVIDGLMAMQNT